MCIRAKGGTVAKIIVIIEVTRRAIGAIIRDLRMVQGSDHGINNSQGGVRM